MDTSAARRELEGFVAEVTPLVASGDRDMFRRSAVSIERLLASGFAPAFVAAELERAACGHEIAAGDGAGVVLARAPSFSLRLSLLEPGAAAGHRVEGLAGHFAVGVVGPWPVEVEHYRVTPPTRWDVLDRSLRLDGPRRETLVPGAARAFTAGEDVVRMEAPAGAVGVLELRTAPVHRIRWVYDLSTRAPVLAVAADPRSSRIEFACRLLARLGAARDVPALEEITVHPDHFVRWTALQSIVELDFARGRQLVEAALDDPHPHIQSAARRFLREADSALVEQRS